MGGRDGRKGQKDGKSKGKKKKEAKSDLKGQPKLPDHNNSRFGDLVCFRRLPTPSLPLSSFLSSSPVPFLPFVGP